MTFKDWEIAPVIKENTKASYVLNYHIKNKLSLTNSIFRYGSNSYINLLKEVKYLYQNDLITLNENDEFIIKQFDYEDDIVMGIIYENEEVINEAEYNGQEVELKKPFRGDDKHKYYVYVKDPKTGKVKKVGFGSPGIRVKIDDPERREAYAARHGCEDTKDITTPGWWSCRLPRYAKILGLAGGQGAKWW